MKIKLIFIALLALGIFSIPAYSIDCLEFDCYTSSYIDTDSTALISGNVTLDHKSSDFTIYEHRTTQLMLSLSAVPSVDWMMKIKGIVKDSKYFSYSIDEVNKTCTVSFEYLDKLNQSQKLDKAQEIINMMKSAGSTVSNTKLE